MPVTRRQLDFQTFDQLIADVEKLRRGGYDQAGAWALPQVLDHLATATVISMDASKGVPRPVKWVLRPILSRMLRTRSMPKMPAPKFLRPSTTVNLATANARFDDIIQQSAALTGDKIDHPAFGWITVHDWQQLVLIHSARHLSFLVPHAE